jgi:S-adenosylmethionine:tRNA ribosyltransferase-isomerase
VIPVRHVFEYSAANLPPEFYGYRRDDVKLLSIDRKSGLVSQTPFTSIHQFLSAGDMLVFNNSTIVPSSLDAYYPRPGIYGRLNFGTGARRNLLLCEPRPREAGREIMENDRAVILPSSTAVRFVERHGLFHRYWWVDVGDYTRFRNAMARYGRYIRYDHIPFDLPASYYVNPFGGVPGSVEYPSASRPFTRRVLSALQKKGVRTAEITLHCNISSLESEEFERVDRLLDEEYAVTEENADRILAAAEEGGRVLAVGTSVLRALESWAGKGRAIHSRTELYIRPGFSFRIADGLITGMHEADGSHIDLVAALVDDSTLLSAYSTAADLGFQWHEFGDITLIA